MTVGVYNIDYYPDRHQPASRAAGIAIGVAKNTHNIVGVYVTPPVTEGPIVPRGFNVHLGSDINVTTDLIQALFDSD